MISRCLVLLCVALFARTRGELDACTYTANGLDSVWRYRPGRIEWGCHDMTLETYCCVEPKYSVTWSQRLNKSQPWQELDSSQILLTDRGQRLILPRDTLPESESQLKCHVVGTDQYAVKTLKLTACDYCREGEFIYPDHKVTMVPSLPEHPVRFRCQIFVGCSDPDTVARSVSWLRRPVNGTFFGMKPLEGPRYSVNNSLAKGSIVGEVLIEPVVDDDYNYEYLCSGYSGPRIFRLFYHKPPGSVMTPTNPVWVVIPTVLPLLLVALLIFIYTYRLHIRVILRTFSRPDSNQQILLINSTSSSDIVFIESVLLPELENVLNLNVVVNYRDFLVSNEDEQSIAYLKECNRVVLVLSNQFLNDPRCNWAFELANSSDNSKLVFLCTEDLTDWTPGIHDVLKRRLKYAGQFYSPCRKLLWQPEFSNIGSPSSNGHISAFKNFKLRRDKNLFWKKMRLAMPVTRPITDRSKRYEVGNYLPVNNQSYSRQASTASDAVLHL